MKQFIATKALIKKEGKVLILRESSKYVDGTNAAKFDVPGGRLSVGEPFKEALLREIEEETSLQVEIGQPFYVGEWRPVVKGEEWQIVGVFFECEYLSGEISLSEDHDGYEWIDPKDYAKYNLIGNLTPMFKVFGRKK